MKLRLAVALMTVLTTTSVFAQSVSKQLQDMKDAISAQQQQIQQLQQQVQNRDQAIQALQQQVSQAQAAAQAAQATANQAVPQAEALDKQYFDPLQHDVADLKTVSGNTVNELQDTQKRVAALESPLSLHFKGITLTPGGFLSGDTYYRNRATGGEGTSFNSIAFAGSSLAHMSEFYGSGRQSRATLLAEGKIGNIHQTSYYEVDFMSAGVTSNNNQTNGYTLRQRQVWTQSALSNGWSFTGGQMWSLIVETRKGLDNRTEAILGTVDPNYNVGWSYVRQYGFRVVKNFNNKFWLGASVEASQINTPATSGTLLSNYLVGSAGLLGGLYNNQANYSFNATPDFVFKGAWEPGFGHYEAFVMFDSLRDRVFPCATGSKNLATCPAGDLPGTAQGAYNSNTTTGGFGANARWETMNKHLQFALHFFGGTAIGRYGASGLPDVTFNPNGTIGKIRNYQGLGTIEYHSPKWDMYFYGGSEYEQRRYQSYPNAAGETVYAGYGSPYFANYGCTTEQLPGAGGFSPGALEECTGNTRNLIEGTAVFWYKFYNGPMGRLQAGGQYSYVVRNTWVGLSQAKPAIIGAQPTANDSIVLTSFRWFLP